MGKTTEFEDEINQGAARKTVQDVHSPNGRARLPQKITIPDLRFANGGTQTNRGCLLKDSGAFHADMGDMPHMLHDLISYIRLNNMVLFVGSKLAHGSGFLFNQLIKPTVTVTMKFKLKPLAILIAAAPLTAFAATELPPVEVTSTKAATVPAGAQELTSEQIKAARAATSDSARLLADFPGVSLFSAGGVSALPIIHGLADDRLRTQVDGMDLIAACPNHMNSPLGRSKNSSFPRRRESSPLIFLGSRFRGNDESRYFEVPRCRTSIRPTSVGCVYIAAWCRFPSAGTASAARLQSTRPLPSSLSPAKARSHKAKSAGFTAATAAPTAAIWPRRWPRAISA
jgi:hypothetical protein